MSLNKSRPRTTTAPVREVVVLPIRDIHTRYGGVEVHRTTKPDTYMVFHQNRRIGLVRLNAGRWMSQLDGTAAELPDDCKNEIGAIERLFTPALREAQAARTTATGLRAEAVIAGAS